MIRKIFASALIAGAAAGVIAAALQFAFVVPLILEGELYETGARVHFVDGSAESPAGSPPIGLDLARHGLTVAMSLVTWVGFALILTALFALAERMGRRVDAGRGAVWGLLGFVALNLAPGAGLAPELPGTVAAEITLRQYWWLGTVLATALGIAAIAYRPGPPAIALGAVLILAPHIWGAPELDSYTGIAPPELAAHFVARSLAIAAAIWVSLGTIAGWLWSRE